MKSAFVAKCEASFNYNFLNNISNNSNESSFAFVMVPMSISFAFPTFSLSNTHSLPLFLCLTHTLTHPHTHTHSKFFLVHTFLSHAHTVIATLMQKQWYSKLSYSLVAIRRTKKLFLNWKDLCFRIKPVFKLDSVINK